MLFSDFKLNEQGLLPVVTQDVFSGEVLMVAYMNQEAFEKTIETKEAHYYSRSRKSLWLKGETSGHFQHVKEMFIDCDNDTLLLKVIQEGVACHTGNKTCFFSEIDLDTKEISMKKNEQASDVLKDVYDIIVDRKSNPKEGSYTNYLFEKGIDKILKKVGEETAEVIIGAKNQGNEEIIYEISDLIYHLTVLMVEKDANWNDIYEELKKRK